MGDQINSSIYDPGEEVKKLLRKVLNTIEEGQSIYEDQQRLFIAELIKDVKIEYQDSLESLLGKIDYLQSQTDSLKKANDQLVFERVDNYYSSINTIRINDSYLKSILGKMFIEHGGASIRGYYTEQIYAIPNLTIVHKEGNNGLSVIQVNNKYGFIDPSGTIKIPLDYDHAWSFNHDRALVKKNNDFFFINSYGYNEFNMVFDAALSFNKKGYAYVLPKDGITYGTASWKKISTKGLVGKKSITKLQNYRYLSYEGRSFRIIKAATLNGYSLLINSGFDELTKEYANIGPFNRKHRAFALVSNNYPRYEYIDYFGKVYEKGIVQKAEFDNNGLTIVAKSGSRVKYSLMSMTGDLFFSDMRSIRRSQKYIYIFSCEGSSYGFYDHLQNDKIDCIYTSINNFVNDRSIIRQDGYNGEGVINRDGLHVIYPIFRKITFDMEEQLFTCENGNGETFKVNRDGICIDKPKRYIQYSLKSYKPTN